MDMKLINHDRFRRAPRSPIPRTNTLLAALANWHDEWLVRRAHARWRRELQALDARILDDIGLTYAQIDDVSRTALARDSATRGTAGETTFPPQYHRGLAKLAHHIET